MRSPTLLTGVTGSVAVMVLVYVGLTAMNLQPHITFGDPPTQVASLDKPPEKPAAPQAATSAPATPATPGPSPTDAEPPKAPPTQTQSSDNPAASEPPVAAPSTTSAELPVAASAPVSPSTPVPPSETSPPPAAAVTPAAPPVVAATSPQPTNPDQGATGQMLPSPEPAKPSTPDVASSPPAPPVTAPAKEASSPSAASPEVTPPVAMALPPSSPVEDSAIADRMAPPPMPSASPTPPTPPTPPVPLAASVPTPLARPQAPAEKLASAEPMPSDDKGGEASRDAAASSGRQAPPTQSAALAPQPEQPQGDAGVAPQANADLKPIDLSRPFAERAGILTIGGRSVQLAGIVPTDPGRSCTGPNGKDWPCGTLARTALRSFLLGRTITCDVPDPDWKGSVTADCRFSRVNLGDWLARNGWAEVAAGSPFASAADEARKAGRGVYGNDPRKKHQSTLAPEPPKEDPLNPI